MQELSLLPNALNGKLLAWADKMIEQGICEKTAPKMRAFLLNPTKSKVFCLELTVVVSAGKSLKARNTKLEGDTFEFITGYDTVMHMGEAIKNPTTPELIADVQKLAVANGAAPTVVFQPAAPPAATQRDGSVLEILNSLSPAVLKTVNISVSSSLWDPWPDDGVAPQLRYVGKPTSWACQDEGKEVLRTKWEMGRDDNGDLIVDGQGKPKYAPTEATLVSRLVENGLRLEPFDDGAPPPKLSSVVELAASDTHLLSSTDLSSIEVLLARARAVVSPAAKYFETSMEGTRGGQLARMKAARLFNPLHVLASGEVTAADIDGLELFRFAKHPKIAPKIQACRRRRRHRPMPQPSICPSQDSLLVACLNNSASS